MVVESIFIIMITNSELQLIVGVRVLVERSLKLIKLIRNSKKASPKVSPNGSLWIDLMTPLIQHQIERKINHREGL